MKDWLLNELVPENIVLEDEKEWGEGEIIARESIKLLPGYNSSKPLTLKIKQGE